MTKNTPAIRPFVAILNGKIKTNSLKIAEHFNKRHDNVLRDIQNLECSKEFTALNFEGSEYLDASGKVNLMYEITRDGFTFLAMGFTGKEAARWKEAYIAAFNALEAELNRQAQTSQPDRFIGNPQKECARLINSRAYALAMIQYSTIKCSIEAAIRREPYMTPAELEEFLQNLDVCVSIIQTRRAKQ